MNTNKECMLKLYVSPEGNDAWSGRLPKPNAKKTDGPFATVARAADAVRDQTGGVARRQVEIIIRGGCYRLEKPLVFSSADFGARNRSLTFKAYRGEKIIISGGRPVTGWWKEGSGLWTTGVSSDLHGPDGMLRQLFVNGRRAVRARLPLGKEYFRMRGEWRMGKNLSEFLFCRGDMKKEWARGGAAEIVTIHKWTAPRKKIAAIDVKKGLAQLAGKSFPPPHRMITNARYWVENIPDGLKAPGAWYYDVQAKRLYYRPLPGETIAASEFIVPVLPLLICFDGNALGKRPVVRIVFAGIEFSHTAWTMGEEGCLINQAANDIPAAVQGTGAEHCAFYDCRFAHLGGYAVEFAAGCHRNKIAGCEITDIGAGGIKIGMPKPCANQKSKTVSSGNEVIKNHIHDIGNVYPEGVGVLIMQSAKNRVAHNHIHTTYYSGVSVGWTWGYGLSNAGGNIVEFNHIHDIGRGMLNDMGGIYTLGIQRGSVLRNNVIHDVSCAERTDRGYGGWGLYTDEGSSYIRLENNIVYRCRTGGFHQHYGRENIVRNNILYGKGPQVIRGNDAHISFTFERNIVVCESGSPLAGAWTNNQYRIDHNLYFFPGADGTFYLPASQIALRPFPNGFAAEIPRFDRIRIQRNAARHGTPTAGSRLLGTVPSEDIKDISFDSPLWKKALLLPNLVFPAGVNNFPGSETETRVLIAGRNLCLQINCPHSRVFNATTTNSFKQENIEVYLRPDLSSKKAVQFMLDADGTAQTFYYPDNSSWKKVAWRGIAERHGTGWRALLIVSVSKTASACGGSTPEWGILIARITLLPALTFDKWRALGYDCHSLIADPLFRDPKHGNFRMHGNSLAQKIGFRYIA